MIDGVYQTAGKRSPKFANGSRLYEGVFNRAVAKHIQFLAAGIQRKGRCEMSKQAEIINLVDTEEDLSLRTRVRVANSLHKEKRNCIYVSIHANAFGDGKTFNSAKGICTFHHYNSRNGKRLAQTLQPRLAGLTGFRDRGIIANDRWANFYVLRKTHMPAVLSENGFMTNLEDATALMTQEMVEKVGEAHFQMIMEIEQNGL
jgi:N-acetylmuramoyl-L-alanine amidase